jgi:hypothetical protein
MSRSRPTPMAKKIPIRFDESVFNPLYLGELYNNAPIQIAFGGAGSGKSRFYAQRDVIDLAQRRPKLFDHPPDRPNHPKKRV